MPYCQKCGSEIPYDASFCPACGAPVDKSAARPAAVSPDLQVADIGPRAVAAIIDHIIIFIIAIILRLIIAAIMFPFFWTFKPAAYFGLFGLNWVL